MKNTILLLFICLYVPTFAQPKLEIVDGKYDFGMIPNQSTVSQKFWFKSIGTDTLKFLNIKTGCTCAILPLDKDFLPPGDSMEVRFLWDVGRRIFKIGRYPYIYTNAQEEPYRMSLTGEVHASLDSLHPISIAPFKGELSVINDKSIDEITFTFTNQTNKNYNFTVVSSASEECTVETPQSISAMGKAVGKIKVKDEFLDKEFRGSITLMINNKDNTRITIPYRRKIY